MNAILLPSIESINLFLKDENKYKNYKICTNNPTVKIYLKYKLKKRCIDINDYFSSQKRNFWFPKLLNNYIKSLKKIDLNLSNNLKPNLREIMDGWIFNLYRYDTFFYYFGLFNFRNALTNFIFKKKIKKLYIFKDFKSYHMFFSNNDVERIIKSIKKTRFIFIDVKNSYRLSFNQVLINYKKKIKRNILTFKNLKFSLLNLINNKRNILIFEPLYEVDINEYNSFNIYFKDISKIFILKKKFATNNYLNFKKIFNFPSDEYEEKKIIFDKIKKHFEENFEYLIYDILKFKKFIKNKKIKKCIWGLPPAHPNLKVLMIKYLQRKKVPVYGYQHGGCYNDMSQDTFHSLSDYHYCDKFFCYKKNKLNIDRKIIKNLKLADHVSVGSNKIKKNYLRKNYLKKSKKKILFPITNWGDNFAHNMGMSTSEVLSRQEKILRFFKKINAEVIIKFVNFTDSKYKEISYPGYHLAKYLKNKSFIFEEKLNLQQSINFYKPNLIVLETISTPLYESIINDCDIICYDSNQNKLKKNVRKILSKRVHIAGNDKKLLNMIKKYSKGKLKIKRDKTFLDNYLLNNNLKKTH